MPTIVAANESNVQINEKPVDGVRSIEYSHRQARENIYALGSAERGMRTTWYGVVNAGFE